MIDTARFPSIVYFSFVSNGCIFLLLTTENCSYQHCSIGSTFTPKLRGRFLATENFFYTSKVLRMLISDIMLVMYISLRPTKQSPCYFGEFYEHGLFSHTSSSGWEKKRGCLI